MRKTAYRINNLFTVILVAAILVFVNFLSYNFFVHKDMTESLMNSLDSSTLKILKRVKKPLYIYAFYKNDNPYYPSLSKLLDEYKIRNKNIKVYFVDPDLDPKQAMKYGVRNEMIVMIYGDKREDCYGISEEKITATIYKLVKTKEIKIYFLMGHGERKIDSYEKDSFTKVAEALKNSGYKVKELYLAGKNEVPKDCDILVIASPKTSLPDEEFEIIKKYYDNGGKIFLMLDTALEKGVRFSKLANYLGVSVFNGFIVDYGAHLWKDVTAVACKRYKPHYITEKLASTVFPLVRPIKEAKIKPSNGEYYIEELIKSDPRKSYIETGKEIKFDDKDYKGQATILIACKKTNFIKKVKDDVKTVPIDARAVVCGDSTFATDKFVEYYANGDLFFNSIEWLAADKDVLTIKPVNADLKRIITLTNVAKQKIIIITMIAIPALIFLSGLFVIVRRNRE